MVQVTQEVLYALRERIEAAGSQLQAARNMGISAQYLSDVLHRRRAPGTKLLRSLGFRKRIIIERIA